MKKAKLLCLSMLASMVLAGCGSARASFKDINVEKRMENADVALLSAQIKNELKENLSSYTLKSSSLTKTAIREVKAESTQELTLHSGNIAHYERVTKRESKREGLVEKREVKTVGDLFYYNDKYVTSYVVDDDEVSCRLQQGKADEVYEVAIEDVLDLFKNLTAYEDSKGNRMFVANAYNENYVPVAFGTDTKVVHEITKNQALIEIDKNNRPVSYYSYQSRETNQDPDTGEIANKTSLVSEAKVSGEFSYGKRKEMKKGLGDIISQIQNNYVFVNGPVLKAKYGDTELQLAKNITAKQVGYSKVEYFASVEFEVGAEPLNNNNSSFRFFIEGGVKKFGAEGDATAVSADIVTFSGDKVDLTFEHEVELMMKYTVELGSESTPVINDVFVYIV